MYLYCTVFILPTLCTFLFAYKSPFNGCSRRSFGLNTNNRQYGISRYGKEHYLKKLNSPNVTEREEHMFAESGYRPNSSSDIDDLLGILNGTSNKNLTVNGLQIIFNPGLFDFQDDDEDDGEIWLFGKPNSNSTKMHSDQKKTQKAKQKQRNQRQQRRENREKDFSDQDEPDRDVTTVLDIEKLKRLPKLL